jgi:chromate transporter
MTKKPSLKEALKFWLKLGFISFGGPAGQVAIMHEFLVEKKKWISESRFMHALNYCMLLPGPEAQQLATYTGWLLHGVRGGLAAGILFILPSMFILLGLSALYVLYGQIGWVSAMFDGLKPAVVAIIAMALMKIGKKSLLSPFHYVVAVAAFVAIFFLKIPFPLIIIAAIIIGFIAGKWMPQLVKSGNGNSKASLANEEGYLIHAGTITAKGNWSPVKVILLLVLFAVLWLVPFLALRATDEGRFWQVLILFFTKAAFVTFGGAYAVLPYVAQVTVQKLHWLSSLQMMDGLALGETTPGPLIMVLAFVGFMAAYNQYGFSLAMGSLGLVITVFYTFLPCFLFIFAGAPIIERTRDNPAIKRVLHIITAAVVGVVLNLAIFLLIQVVFYGKMNVENFHISHFLWIVISFFALYKFKINMIAWLGISAVYGLANNLVSTML